MLSIKALSSSSLVYLTMSSAQPSVVTFRVERQHDIVATGRGRSAFGHVSGLFRRTHQCPARQE